jgi:hypothetical protein
MTNDNPDLSFVIDSCWLVDCTKLGKAVYMANLEMFMKLTHKGFDPNQNGLKKPRSMPILNLLVMKKPLETNPNNVSAMLQLILQHPSCEPVKDGNTNLLFLATEQPAAAILKELLKHPKITKETVNKARDDGETPIQNSAISGNVAAMKLLLEAGADANLKGGSGFAAFNPLEIVLNQRWNHLYSANNYELFKEAVALLAPHTKMPISPKLWQIGVDKSTVQLILDKWNHLYLGDNRELFDKAVSWLTPHIMIPGFSKFSEIKVDKSTVPSILGESTVQSILNEYMVQIKPPLDLSQLTCDKTLHGQEERFIITIPKISAETPSQHKGRIDKILGSFTDRFENLEITMVNSSQCYVVTKEGSKAFFRFSQLADELSPPPPDREKYKRKPFTPPPWRL